MQCENGGLVKIRHKNVADDWGTLCATDIRPSAVAHQPLINYGGLRIGKLALAADPEDEETYRQEKEERKGVNNNIGREGGYRIQISAHFLETWDVVHFRPTDKKSDAARNMGAPPDKILEKNEI